MFIKNIMRPNISPLVNILRNGCRTNALANQQKRSYYMYSPEPFHPIPNKYPDWKSVEDALSVVTSGKIGNTLSL